MVTYNKNGTVTKGSRVLHSGGPRDRQVKLAVKSNIQDLQNLKEELVQLTTNNQSKETNYSKEQIQTLVNDSIEEVSIDLEKKYLQELGELRTSIISKDELIAKLTGTIGKLEDKLDVRDSTILELTTKVTSMASKGFIVQPAEAFGDPKRPSIEQIFIDPTKKGAEDKYESHVTMEEEQSTKGNVNKSVDKLKALMGNKIPKI